MQMNSQEDIFLKNLISKNLEVILMYSSYIYKVLINVDIQAIDHKTKGFTVLFHMPSLYNNCFEPINVTFVNSLYRFIYFLASCNIDH